MFYLQQFLIGGFITTIFSLAASKYETNPEYIKIIAFMWGIPLLYFYILYIAWRTGHQAGIDVTLHALFGIMFTIIAMIMTLLISKFGKQITILCNILLLLVIIFVYFKFKLYNISYTK